jgi:Cu(I)/Ag(I) efflux system membrane fusion protein
MNKATVFVGVLCLGLGLAAGYLLFNAQPGPDPGAGAAAGEREPLFYRNPMNPEITSPVPAKDSMGMDYIPVYAGEQDTPVAGTVKIDPVTRSNIGVRTARAQVKALGRTVRAAGRIDYNEQALLSLHPKVEGWIREMRVDKTGQAVADDDILLTIYSPKLVATQQEYLLALENHAALKDSPFEDVRSGAGKLVSSARERLVLLDVPEHQIVELEQSGQVQEGLHIHAPGKGTVLAIGAREGQFVTPATELYRIADLDTVWVYADIYEYELPWVKVGDAVEMTLQAAPGRVFTGEVDYIYPYAQQKTRTTRVRMTFDNRDGALRPEAFVDISIRASQQPDQVVIPAEAVVRSGDFAQVFVATHDGEFEPRRVQLGLESRGEVAVLQGIEAGERVVVSSQFLIDSESKLREATAKMTPPEDAGEYAGQHGGHMNQQQHEGMDHD